MLEVVCYKMVILTVVTFTTKAVEKEVRKIESIWILPDINQQAKY